MCYVNDSGEPEIIKQEANLGSVGLGRVIMWWATNLGGLVLLYFAIFNNVLWCQNLIKFIVWLNFIIWLIVFWADGQSLKILRYQNFPVSEITNGIYGLVVAGTLASFGWFGYSAMVVATLIAQQSIYFGDWDDKKTD